MEAVEAVESNEHPSSSPTVEEPRQRWRQSITYHIRVALANGAILPEVQEDTVSCLVILLTFWFFASVTTILGFYGPVELDVGPGCSRLVRASSVFVQNIKVRVEEGSGNGLVLHGLAQPPPLDVPAAWSEAHQVTAPANFHKEWVYFLNQGAQIEISYSVKSEGSYPLSLIIAQGKENLMQWMAYPLIPNTTLSWNLVHGTGVIKQSIDFTLDYYIAVGNLNNQEMTVLLDFRIKTFVYNTTGANYRCSPGHGLCSYKLSFLGQNVAVLSSGPTKKANSDELYAKLSYGPRWITYFIASGIMTVALLLVYKVLKTFMFSLGVGDGTAHRSSDTTNERTPLLMKKDDDNVSLGSSYESVSHDEEDMEEWLRAEAAKALENGESRAICAVCWDARRDCFFLPCGHSATCYTCGARISEEAGNCPVCRRKLKKVRRIFTV